MSGDMYITALGINSFSQILDRIIIVYQMEFDETRWSCLRNSEQKSTQNSAKVTFCLSKTGLCVVISS